MPVITTCVFCETTAINHDHDECARKFGENLKSRVFEFCERNPGKPLPAHIADDYHNERWQHYQKYLARNKARLEKAQKVAKYSSQIQKELQIIADTKMKEIDPNFFVIIDVKVDEVASYAVAAKI